MDMDFQSDATDNLARIAQATYGKKTTVKLSISDRGCKRIQIYSDVPLKGSKAELLDILEEEEPSEPQEDFDEIAAAMVYKLVHHTDGINTPEDGPLVN